MNPSTRTRMQRTAGLVAAAICLAALRVHAECGMVFVVETPAGEKSVVAPGQTVAITIRALYSVYLTIPITDCFKLTADVRIEGGAWDNDRLVALQPMNKLVWKEDYDAFALVAAGIFRATEAGTYHISVSYGDESREAPVLFELTFSAG